MVAQTMEQSMTLDQQISKLKHDLALAQSQLREDYKYTYKLEQWIKLPWIKQLYTPKPFKVYKCKERT